MIILFALIVSFPKITLAYAADGLMLWFENVIPALFPFMIFSNILVRQNLAGAMVQFCHPMFGKLFGVSKNGTYTILTGFLCGFPMGAKNVGDFYRQGQLSQKEATLLLVFCNNLSPSYFCSIVVPAVRSLPIPFPLLLLGMYGIPLGYGFLLSKRLNMRRFMRQNHVQNNQAGEHHVNKIHACTNEAPEEFSVSIQYAIQSAINSVTMLGGYMILANLMMLFPYVLIRGLAYFSLPLSNNIASKLGIFHVLLEISGGIAELSGEFPLLILCLLPLGGLSCILQTKSMLMECDLSLKNYLFHKIMQTGFSFVYYFFLLCLF